eukprot:g2496.t1
MLRLLLLLLLWAVLMLSHAADGAAAEEKGIAIATYLPEWRYSGANFDILCKYSSHLIFFSLEMVADGRLLGFERMPSQSVIAEARRACSRHGSELLICFGGNGRSAGFAKMTASKKSRSAFISNVMQLLEEHGLHGVDLNWEYPGYQFGRGYLSSAIVDKEYDGLRHLLLEMRKAFGSKFTLTLAYYPDSRQERLLKEISAPQLVDFMHAMAYDAGGGQHSQIQLAEQSIAQAKAAGFGAKATLGLPFYGRHVTTGDWTSYEDILRDNKGLTPEQDLVSSRGKDKGAIFFNNVLTIRRKVQLAINAGIGGLMIWEGGQDCRLEPVERDGQLHVRTCRKDEDSLLKAIADQLEAAGVQRWRHKSREEL